MDRGSDGRPDDAVPVGADQVTITYRPERDGDPDPGERVVAGARRRHPDLA